MRRHRTRSCQWTFDLLDSSSIDDSDGSVSGREQLPAASPLVDVEDVQSEHVLGCEGVEPVAPAHIPDFVLPAHIVIAHVTHVHVAHVSVHVAHKSVHMCMMAYMCSRDGLQQS